MCNSCIIYGANDFKAIIPGNFKMFYVDNLNNIYTLNQKNIISKYDVNGKLLFSANFKIYGDITSIDASNPLKILIFYKDQNMVIITDNTLSKIGNINLSDLGFYEVLVCCRSADNGIWILDGTDFKLKKINDEYSTVLESENINFYLKGDIRPSFLIEQNKFLYLNIPSASIYIFDIYGSFFKKIPINNIFSFTIINDELFFYRDSTFYCYSLKTFEEKALILPLKRNVDGIIIDIKITSKYHFIHSSEGIFVLNN